MQIVFDEEVARRANLTDVQLRAEGVSATEHVTFPLKGRRLRLLHYGGGGCEKTRIINCVLAKLFRGFKEAKDPYVQPSRIKHRDSFNAKLIIQSPRYEVVNFSLWLDCV